jgi:hypothetical protein
MPAIKSAIVAYTLLTTIFVPQVSLANNQGSLSDRQSSSSYHTQAAVEAFQSWNLNRTGLATVSAPATSIDLGQSSPNAPSSAEVEENRSIRVRIYNNSSKPIREVYIANYADDHWGNNFISVASQLDEEDIGIPPNGAIDFTFNQSSYQFSISRPRSSTQGAGTRSLNMKGCRFNIKVVFSNNSYSEKLDVNLCSGNSVGFGD